MWNNLLLQAKLTLNLLRSSITCQKLSVHAHLNGVFDYNVTPVTLPVTQAILYEDPSHRMTYGLDGMITFYLGP